MLDPGGAYPTAAEEVLDIRHPRFLYDEAMAERQEPSELVVPSDAEIDNSKAFRVEIEAGAKIALPAAVCRHLQAAAGDFLVLDPQQDGTVSIASLSRVVREARGMLRERAPGVSVVDELIAERREEARRESEE